MRLRLLTLNVWGLPWPVSRDLDARIEAIGRELPNLDVDVAAFQEVWIENAREALIAAGHRAGFESVWHRPAALGGSGLLVLSKLPIAKTRFDSFDLGGFPERFDQADYYGGKGFALLTLETAAGEIVLVDTHLQAGYSRRALDIYIGHRTAQVIALASSIRSVSGPLVLLGDFNFQDMYEEHKVLTGLTGLRDVARDLDQRQDTALRTSPYRAGQRSSSSRIDLIFARDGVDRSLRPVSSRRVLSDPISLNGRDARYSDHAGVRAEIELIPGGRSISAPDREAIDLARLLLGRGQQEATRRRFDRRGQSALAGVTAGSVLWAARRSETLSRRRFLRAGCVLGGAVAGGLGGAGLWLAEGYGRHELRAYDDALRTLEAIEREET